MVRLLILAVYDRTTRAVFAPERVLRLLEAAVQEALDASERSWADDQEGKS